MNKYIKSLEESNKQLNYKHGSNFNTMSFLLSFN